MKKTLCIFTSELGASFIDKHVRRLRPGSTVAVALYDTHPHAKMFGPPCPALQLDRWALRIPVRLARRAGLSVERLREAEIERFLRHHNVGAVLGEYMDQFIDFVPLLDRMGIPYIVQAHGIDVSASLLVPGFPDRYLAYKSTKAILTRCEFHRRRLIGIGLPAELIHVNPGGVDFPAAPPPPRPLEAGFRFLAVGFMVPQKAPLLLLEAFRQAAARDPRLTLDYVGGGPLFDAAPMFVRACGLEDRIRIHGIVPEAEKERLLRECGVFVQHSVTVPVTGHEEGLPAAIQEAMGHGLAVVSTRHSGVQEAVIEGETGLLVEEGDVAGMAEAFLRVPSLAEAMGQAGFRRADGLYRWEHEKARIDDHLSKLI